MGLYLKVFSILQELFFFFFAYFDTLQTTISLGQQNVKYSENIQKHELTIHKIKKINQVKLA